MTAKKDLVPKKIRTPIRYSITPSEETVIIDLFHLGYGPGRIGNHLKIRSTTVRLFLDGLFDLSQKKYLPASVKIPQPLVIHQIFDTFISMGHWFLQ